MNREESSAMSVSKARPNPGVPVAVPLLSD